MRIVFIYMLLLTLPFRVHAQQVKKTVLVILDGIPPDVLEAVPTPHVDAIAQVGGYTRAYMGGEKGAYSETPTISAVGYNSMLTGTWVNKHHVFGNDIRQPNYHYWTIFRFLEELHPEKKTAIFSTWLDNRTKLVGEGLEATGNLQLDYHYDGFEHDTLQFPHTDDRKFIHLIDEHVTDEAARYLQAEGPDLSWVYLEYTDDIGHSFGDGEEMNEAVKMADDQIGRIWKAIQYREQNFKEDWLILITTDHGREAKTGKGHGGQTDRERAIWITTNAQDLNAHFHEYQPGMVSVFPTVARFMELSIPQHQMQEIDGVPLIGKVSLAEAKLQEKGKKKVVSWKAMNEDEKVNIWLSTTDHFKEGGKDEYQLIAEVDAAQESFTLSEKIIPAGTAYVKLLLEGQYNTLNLWLMKENKPLQNTR